LKRVYARLRRAMAIRVGVLPYCIERAKRAGPAPPPGSLPRAVPPPLQGEAKSSAPISLPLEIPQIRRRLILVGGHQLAVGAQELALLAEEDVEIVFRAGVLDPGRVAQPAVGLVHGPWLGEGMIEGRDDVVQHVA